MGIETKQHNGDGCPARKSNKTLLEKYNIPVTYLDFKFVENCTDVLVIEKVLSVLRSGEEGYYPEFQDFVQKKLESLNPLSRHLRVETPVIRSNALERTERSELENDLATWLGQCEKSLHSGDIFDKGEVGTDIQVELPIRGTVTTNVEIKQKEILPSSDKNDGFLKPKNQNRIKSWDYEKWDKFNVDAELTKLEIQDMQEEEKLKNQNKTSNLKLEKPIKSEVSVETSEHNISSNPIQESARPSTSQSRCDDNHQVEYQRDNYQKNLNGSSSVKQIILPEKVGVTDKSFSNLTFSSLKLGPSFIEEISEESETVSSTTAQTRSSSRPLVQEVLTSSMKPKVKKEGKRFKIIIEDLKIG